VNIVITGTCSGLGQSLRDRFKAMGHMVIGSTNIVENERADQPFMDLRSTTSLRSFADFVFSNMQFVDVLINNAGTNGIRRFEEIDDMFLQEMMQVNFVGPVMLTKTLLRNMRPDGAIVVNITSDAAWRPMRHSLAYNASKAALDMATKQMARELTKPYNLSVVGIRPGKMSGTGMSAYIEEQVCAMRGWTPEQAKDYAAANSVTGFEMPTDVMAQHIYNLVTSGVLKFASGACMDLAG